MTGALYVLAGKVGIAETALAADHGIDPRNPEIRIVVSVDQMMGLPAGTPVWVVDPLLHLSAREWAAYCAMLNAGRFRDWTEQEKQALAIPAEGRKPDRASGPMARPAGGPGGAAAGTALEVK